MKKKLIIIILTVILGTLTLSAEVMTNAAKGLKGPALYGVYFINKKPPEFLEDYYDLYAKRMYYGEDEIHLNVYFLKKGLISPFRHASKALCLLKTPQEETKYRNLLKMHLNLKIMQNYLYLGRLYDKRIIYHFNMPFKEDLIKSLNIAKFYYNLAREYWPRVLAWAGEASKIDVRIDMDFLEDELWSIQNRDKEVDWDYDYTFDIHLSGLEKNLKKLSGN
ncbi:MAG: hypothetical protein JW827_02170 [Spirochaetes bacterium]|nr:hypothetical protein [Spirochaetota bacterium]